MVVLCNSRAAGPTSPSSIPPVFLTHCIIIIIISSDLLACLHSFFYTVGMDVLYRNPPSFNKRHPKVGKCRNDRDYCEDCMVTPLEDIYSAHYTMCRKPWNCIGEGREQRPGDKRSIEEYMVHVDHCLELQKLWHDTRTDLEDKLYALTLDATILESRNGSYFENIFRGHCTEYSSAGYQRISGLPSSFQRIPELYQEVGKAAAAADARNE